MLKNVNFLSAKLSVHKYHSILCVTITLIMNWAVAVSQVPFQINIEKQAIKEKSKFNNASRSNSDDNNIDVTYYMCRWNVNPEIRFISGSVGIYYKYSEQYSGTVQFDCSDALIVDSILHAGNLISFSHVDNQISMSIEGNNTGAVDSCNIYYHGVPESSGFGSFVTDTTSIGNPCMWTLSQPFGAKDWWPCKQSLSDKADSIDIIVRVPIGNYVASNGLLISEDTVDTELVAHWRHRYPIATYLIAIAVSNYERYSEMLPLTTGNLLVQNYAYPEDRGDWEWLSFNTNQAIQYYDSLLIPYPFMREKYGHAQFGWGGGMEHQTMSFMADIGSWLMSHELSHQWFGNYITCGSWRDIWLNESFATYFTGLFYERFSDGFFPIWKDLQREYIMSEPGGKVLVDDTTTVDSIFNPRLTYSKGAAVLQMLRKTIGDEVFFEGLRSYLKDTSLASCFAYTSDFIYHMEFVSNRDLTQFFTQWLETEGYPILNIEWAQLKNNLNLRITQTHSVSGIELFSFVYPISLFNNGMETIKWLEINSSDQYIELELPFSIDSIKTDRNVDFLVKTIITQINVIGKNSLLIYPNPGNSNFTLKSLRKLESKGVKMFNCIGQEVQFNSILSQDGFTLAIETELLSNGIYIFQVNTMDEVYDTIRFIAN